MSAIFDGIIGFINEINTVLDAILIQMDLATNYLDNVNFNGSYIVQFLGYVRWIMGDINYAAFMTMLLIGAGISLWQFSLRAVDLIKSLLPW